MAFTKYTKEVWKGSVITSPLPPTLVTCGNENEANVFTVAWTGILCTQPPVTYISVRPERYSYDIIKNTGEFVINLATENLVKVVDLCGVKSGRNVNKFELTGLTCESAAAVSVPIIAECPINIECKVREIVPLGTHDMFIADILKINAAKELIDENGRLELEKAGLLAYAHGDYYALGKRIGSFGYSVRKNKKHKNQKYVKNGKKH
jgi:flavin reductase (DIM6/NTAB) family NADH-FMN oxidoreductase RutF